MISTSVSQRVRLLLEFRAAGLRIPTMGANRSTLSRRTILFLLVLLGTPLAARSTTLEDSAKELARKIAAALPARDVTSLTPRDDVSMEIRNVSSLAPEEIAGINQSFAVELRKWGIAVPPSGGVTAEVVVTLSQNFTNYIWTAEIRQGNTSQVALVTLPLPLVNRVVSDSMRATLHGDKVWQGSERIVDVTFVILPNLEYRMVLLVPDGLIITKPETGAAFQRIEFPPARTHDREPKGSLFQVGSRVESRLNGRDCEVALDVLKLVRCSVPRPIEDVPLGAVVSDKPDYGDQVKDLPSNCGINNPVLVTGNGDYSQSDSVQILSNRVLISNQLNFPGPVLRFSQGQDTQFVTAIVHNLKDGNYEAYRLSMSCGQ
ncbi:MAG: hypothetical protein LAO19_19080 [Acidobacteriia bacterium]|nr:hypothetical protein [Terriglobia bacterium]